MDQKLMESLKNCGLKTEQQQRDFVNTLFQNHFSIINIADLNALKRDRQELEALYAAGVDNWEGFEMAQSS